MEGKDLVVVRNEAIAALNAPPAARPEAGSGKHLLAVLATWAVLSAGVVMWLHIITGIRTSPIPSVQLVSIEAQTPPPSVEIARSFEIVAPPTEQTQEAAAEETQRVATAEPEPALPKFQAWAAQRAADAPTENAQPLEVAPAKDAEAKASAALDREREQEALADKRWKERHARRLVATRKNLRTAQQPAQPQKPQQQQAQKPQQFAPTASAAAPVVPHPSDSQRGGG
jgi:hypothetical protein